MDLPPAQVDNKTVSDIALKRQKQAEKHNQIVGTAKTLIKYFGAENPYAITAMLGNIDVETGNSFDYLQKQGGGGPGRGLFQFDFHKPQYAKYLKRKGLEDSADSQVRYVHDAIYGDEQEFLGFGNAKKLRKLFASSRDAVELSDGFQNIFLRPKKTKAHTDRRREASRMYTMAFVPAK